MTYEGKLATREKLAQVLHAKGLFDMETAARSGRYDDYLSESATPIVDLVLDLRASGHEDLARRAMNGEWDAQGWEAEEWSKTEEAQQIFRALGESDE